MRLPFFTLLVSSATLFSLFPAPVSAIHPHALSRRDHSRSPVPQVLTSRQHRIARDLLDVCINVNVDLLADASQLLGLGGLLGPLNLGSKIQLCLCLKDLDIYLSTNADVQALVGLVGKNTVSALITALINTSPDAQQCTFPTHAHHTCNNSDPCHYDCDPGYVRDGNTCVCAPPNVSCNGVCGSFPQGCGSAVPHSMKKRTGPIVTIAQAKATCKLNDSVCGIPGQENTMAFECIDTDVAKDSCGGCMVPHPFLEAELVPKSSGQDCGAILNVKSSTCFEKSCVVNACQVGWQPNSHNSGCVPDDSVSGMRRIKKRSNPISVQATVDARIDPNLLSQLVSIGDMVVALSSLSSFTSPSTNSATQLSFHTISALILDTRNVTGDLLASSTVYVLLTNVDALLGTTSLLNSTLRDCDCVQDLGLTDLTQNVENLLLGANNLKNWCTLNPIIPSSSAGAVSSSSIGDQPIIIGLSYLLNKLGVDGQSGVLVGGPTVGLAETSNNLLDGLDLGPNDYKRRSDTFVNTDATVDSDLLANIITLIDLIIDLQGYSTSLLSPAAPPSPAQPPYVMSSINCDLIDPIVQASAKILESQTVFALLSAIDSLVDANGAVNGLLDQCGCVDALSLQPLVVDLEKIVALTLNIQNWCNTHPIADSGPSSPTLTSGNPPTSLSTLVPGPGPSTIPNTADVPIVLGLSSLLTGLRILGPVKAGVSVGGLLGLETNGAVNNLLNGLKIGPLNYRRRDTLSSSGGTGAKADVNPDLLNQLEALVGLVSNVQESMSALQSISSDALLDSTLVTVVRATADLLQSSTKSSLINNVQTLVSSSEALQDAVAGCGCTELLGLQDVTSSLVRVTEAALGLQSLCKSNSILAIAPVITASQPPPGNIPIILGLDHLLPALGLGGSKGIVALSGLGNGPSDITNGLLNGLQIGPNGIRRRYLASRKPTKPQEPLHEGEQLSKRQIAANVTALVDSNLLGGIDALVDLVLGLNTAATTLPPATTLSSTATVYTTLLPLPTSQPSGGPYDYPPGIDFCLVDNIIEATVALLSSSTYEELLSGTGALVSASDVSLKQLEGCGCVEGLGLEAIYSYLVKIVNTSLSLENWCNDHPAPSGPSPTLGSRPPVGTPTSIAAPTTSASPTSDDEPIVVGLTKLLNGLGLNLQADVVVDGVGKGLDHTVNSLLTALGIGRDGARRRFVQA